MIFSLRLGAVLLALGVITGAFGAHGLKNILDEYGKDVWEKAVLYHLIHALGILAIGIMAKLELLPPGRGFTLSLLLAVGILLFSGSLYVLAVSGIKWLGAITPIGGTLFIVGWIWLALSITAEINN